MSSDVPATPTTGVGTVDRALASLDDVEQRPVAERAAVFEQAHTALRAALDPGDGDDLGDDLGDVPDPGLGGDPSGEPGAGSA